MSSLITDITLGADPEVFIKELPTGKFIPSLDLIGGTKLDPRPLSIPGFFVQEDNVLAEFNIPPSKTKIEFIANIKSGITQLENILGNNHRVEIATSHKFTPEDLKDPRAEEFGCDPDFNAWFEEINPRPHTPTDGLRTAGGHIHVGYKLDIGATMDDRAEVNKEIVKWMDLYLGVPSMKLDTDSERRRLYGRAGAYRNKEYGVEYRTLSSFWLKSEKLIDWVWEMTHRAVDRVGNLEFIENNLSERILMAINRNDMATTDSLISQFKLVTP